MKYFLGFFFLLLSQASHALPQFSTIDPEIDLQNQTQNLCSGMLHDRDYKKLENYLNSHQFSDENKDFSGIDLAPVCMDGLVHQSNLGEIEQWHSVMRKSIYPVIARQTMLLYGIKNNWSTSLPQDLTIRQRAFESMAYELDSVKSSGVNMLWYDLRLKVAFYEDDKSQYLKLAHDAVSKYPNSSLIYETIANNWGSAWNYSRQELDSFILTHVQNSISSDELYAQTYMHYLKPGNVIETTNTYQFDYGKFRHGMNSFLNHYPSNYNYNLFAQASCLLKDKDNAKNLIEHKMTTQLNQQWYATVYSDCLDMIK